MCCGYQGKTGVNCLGDLCLLFFGFIISCWESVKVKRAVFFFWSSYETSEEICVCILLFYGHLILQFFRKRNFRPILYFFVEQAWWWLCKFKQQTLLNRKPQNRRRQTHQIYKFFLRKAHREIREILMNCCKWKLTFLKQI